MTLEPIHALLRSETGIDALSLGRDALATAVRREMDRLGTSDIEAYTRTVLAKGEVFEALAAKLLVHETWFFRYPASFRRLAEIARARVAAGRLPLRVLSVACSTGEEPASIALTLQDAGLRSDSVVIDAYDVSAVAIDYARRGRYGPHAFRSFDPRSRPDHFQAVDDRFELDARTRAWIRYRVGNVLAHPEDAAGPYDVIFCRNLLIYLVPEARRHAAEVLDRLLAPDGVLFLGHAEVPGMAQAGFRPEPPHDAFACVRASAPALRAAPTEPPPMPRPLAPPVAPRPAAAVAGVPARRPVDEPPLARARRLADGGALDDAARVLSEVPASSATADHYHLLAFVHRAAGRPGDAQDALRRALYLEPAHYESLLLAALLADAQGDRAAAERLRGRARRARTEVGP